MLFASRFFIALWRNVFTINSGFLGCFMSLVIKIFINLEMIPILIFFALHLFLSIKNRIFLVLVIFRGYMRNLFSLIFMKRLFFLSWSLQKLIFNFYSLNFLCLLLFYIFLSILFFLIHESIYLDEIFFCKFINF